MPPTPARDRGAVYCKARQHGDIVTGCAVTYFRAQALQDADHPDFLGEWI